MLALGAGLVLAAAAPLTGDLAGLVRGYSLMLAGSAAYLVAGLQLLTRRQSARLHRSSTSAELIRQL